MARFTFEDDLVLDREGKPLIDIRSANSLDLLTKTIRAIKKGTIANGEVRVTSSQFFDNYLLRDPRSFDILTGVRVGTLFPESFNSDEIFNFNPRKAARKIVAGDDFFDVGPDIEGLNGIFEVNAGKGDDVIIGRPSINLQIFKGGRGDDDLILSAASSRTEPPSVQKQFLPKLYGGPGKDRFVFFSGSLSSDFLTTSAGVIMDYQPGIDSIVTKGGRRRKNFATAQLAGDLYLFRKNDLSLVAIVEGIASFDDIILDGGIQEFF